MECNAPRRLAPPVDYCDERWIRLTPPTPTALLSRETAHAAKFVRIERLRSTPADRSRVLIANRGMRLLFTSTKSLFSTPRIYLYFCHSLGQGRVGALEAPVQVCPTQLGHWRCCGRTTLRLPRAGKSEGAASQLRVAAAGIFLGLFLILSTIIWSSERALSDRRKAELRQAHTQTVLLEAQHLLAALQDTETAQRSLVITARSGFLEPYEAGRKEIGASLDGLAGMTLNSPIQQARIHQLGNVIAAKIAELSAIVALVQAGNQPHAIIMTERGMG